MSKRTRLTRADLSVDYLRDTKILRLWRACGPEAVLMHLATVLDTWREGERVSIHDTTVDAVPPDVVATMIRLDLLDDEGRIPEASWEAWIAPTVELTARRREAGVEAALWRWHGSPNGSPNRSPNTQTDRQTDRQNPRARAHETSSPRALRDVVREIVGADGSVRYVTADSLEVES